MKKFKSASEAKRARKDSIRKIDRLITLRLKETKRLCDIEEQAEKQGFKIR